MDDATISAVVFEIAPLLLGRTPGKVFQLSHHSLAIDFGLRRNGYLFLSVEPAAPRLYFIKRRVRDLEKQSLGASQLALMLRKELSATHVSAVAKLPDDRIVRLEFEDRDERDQRKRRTLIAQLTGRSANLFLLDENDLILVQVRKGIGRGQTIGESYRPPPQSGRAAATQSPHVRDPGVSQGQSLSEKLDAYYTTLAAEQAAQAQLATARAQLRKEISRRKKLLRQLENDLASHADAEQQKRIGELLLANIGTAERKGNRATVIDYFAEATPEIEVEVDENLTLPEAASRRFEMYARSKRARQQIAARIAEVEQELTDLERKCDQLESSPDAEGLRSLPPLTADASRRISREQKAARMPGVRRYRSTDGYEILVGRAGRDNDNLTFKIAKPNDLWLHAADYPGSHVVVRNPTRKDIPHRTLVEAAQLAAHFSQANKDPKVDVHYTLRKFLSKPKGAAPGLVRMSRFKNVTVAPLAAGQRVR